MNPNSLEVAIGIVWATHALFFLAMGHELIKTAAAYPTEDRWPVAGRWLIALLFISFGIMFIDVVRLRFEWSWLERYLASNPIAWGVLIVRCLPLPVEVWLYVRLRRTGRILTEGER